MRFSIDQHRIWQTLLTRQLPQVERYACAEYLAGLQILRVPRERIPTLRELNRTMTPATGWRAVRTSVRYSDAVPWYRAFAMKQFLVTDYMRSWNELEFTPEPDMFHDIFGHLPFMVLPDYAALQELFAPAFGRASDAQREHIKRLAWFSTEFGLMRENGELKAFGAGLISSIAEIQNVGSGRVPVEPFTVKNVIAHSKAIYSFNEVLFAFDSLESLRRELSAFFDTI